MSVKHASNRVQFSKAFPSREWQKEQLTLSAWRSLLTIQVGSRWRQAPRPFASNFGSFDPSTGR
jgi:hypothetical protein